MKPENNAKPIRLDKPTQVFMLAQIFPESFRKFKLANIMKKSNPALAPPDPLESIHIVPDKPHRYTNNKPAASDPNAFKVTKDAGMPTAPPPEKHPELKNLSTEKPVLNAEQYSNIQLHEIICSGIAYYSGSGYNRHAIGTPKQFVAVMGGASWAIYIGTPLQSVDVIAQEGDKVVLERHVKQLVDCEETIQFYRF